MSDTDPYAALRHLDGHTVVARQTKEIENVDGELIGVETRESPPTRLMLPALPTDNEDED